MLVLLAVRNRYLFSVPIREDGDYAANSILVAQASHFQLLIGNCSRIGFHHPGPAFLYVLAAGEGLFYDGLHLAAAPYNGQLLGALVLDAVLVGLVVRIVHRHTGSLLAAGTTLGVVLAYAGEHRLFNSVWMPVLYVTPFLLLIVAAASVASGLIADLPNLVLAGGLLVHGHVSFLMFVGVTTVVVLLAWYAHARHHIRAELTLIGSR